MTISCGRAYSKTSKWELSMAALNAVDNAGCGHSADARALDEEFRKGFVSESAQITHHVKLLQFV